MKITDVETMKPTIKIDIKVEVFTSVTLAAGAVALFRKIIRLTFVL